MTDGIDLTRIFEYDVTVTATVHVKARNAAEAAQLAEHYMNGAGESGIVWPFDWRASGASAAWPRCIDASGITLRGDAAVTYAAVIRALAAQRTASTATPAGVEPASLG